MSHNNIRSIACVISAVSAVPADGLAESFFVVGKGFANSKPVKLHLGIAFPASGTFSVQVYRERAGTRVPLFVSPVGVDTTAHTISTAAVSAMTFAEGDLILFELLSFTGTARGITATLDLQG